VSTEEPGRFDRLPEQSDPWDLQTGQQEPDDLEATRLAPWAVGRHLYTVEGEIDQIGNLALASKQARGRWGLVGKIALVCMLGMLLIGAVLTASGFVTG
jgi:hypothetical protein